MGLKEKETKSDLRVLSQDTGTLMIKPARRRYWFEKKSFKHANYGTTGKISKKPARNVGPESEHDECKIWNLGAICLKVQTEAPGKMARPSRAEEWRKRVGRYAASLSKHSHFHDRSLQMNK